MQSRAVTVTPTRMIVARGGTAIVPKAILILVVSDAPATVYIGGPDVTTGNGFPVQPGETLGWDMKGDELWAMAGSNADIRVLERDA